MKPGKELDALIAEKVMNWSPVKTYPHGLESLLPPNHRPGGFVFGGPPNYSTDIADAWKVWEWLEANHPWMYSGSKDRRADILLMRVNGLPSVVIMNDYWDNGVCGNLLNEKAAGPVCNPHIPGETYMHAICLAALNVIEAKRP